MGQLVVVLKDTALGSIITYSELLNNYQRIGSTFGNIVPAMIVIALIFILINYSLTVVAGRVEQRMRRAGRSTVEADTALDDRTEVEPEKVSSTAGSGR